ncbi:hypothetical protein jhhlp_005942 [Lomentospora prolificans]|uniref:Transcription factor domain-containing protein n=1 Tax=Lomentospora prolificans TaxID=41688 RepID=A0A2N3N4H7_9PEZI|nr:hypothetical protein jhhlp_005942 [Lomentospora prolificans]
MRSMCHLEARLRSGYTFMLAMHQQEQAMPSDPQTPLSDPRTHHDGSPFRHSSNESHLAVGEDGALHGASPVDSPLDLDDAMRTFADPSGGASPSMLDLAAQQPSNLIHSSLNPNLGHWPMDQPSPVQERPDDMSGGIFGDSNMSPGWLRRTLYPFEATGGESSDAPPQLWQANDPWASRGTIMTPDGCRPAGMNNDIPTSSVSGLPSDELNFDLLGSLGVLSRNRITPALQPEQTSMESLLHTGISQDNLNLGLDMSADNLDPSLIGRARGNEHAQSTLHDAVNQATLTLRGRSGDTSRPTARSFHKLHSDEELVRIISSYPRIMVQPGNYPPFVHHKLYRCSTGDIPEPLAKAFCCIGAFYSSVPTSKNYVYTLLNEESGALVKEFHKWSGSDGDMLAVVHAMCIYQILGFFISNSPEQVRLTELQNAFFLKMTRRLIQEYVHSNIAGDSEEVNWRKWIINETIRRTLFLVNTINTLSCKTQRQDAYYYEPLDKNLIENMALPAPNVLWNASSPEEWLIAKAQLDAANGPRSRPTVRQVLNQMAADQNEAQSAGTGIGSSYRISYDDFDEFTRLIISTVRSPLAEE